VKINKIIKWIL